MKSNSKAPIFNGQAKRVVHVQPLDSDARRFVGDASPRPRLRVWVLVLLGCLGIGNWCFSQPLSDLVFTVGTTHNNWSYIVIGSQHPELLAGKRFAVYGKPGDPSSAASFTQRRILAQENSPGQVQTLLNNSLNLGQDLGALSETLNGVLRRVPGISNAPLNEKVLTLFQAAQTNKLASQMQTLLGRANPGLALCQGSSFAEQIPGVMTYEVRELHPISGAPGDVVGRVTVQPGGAIILPAPGRPFQVMSNQPSEDLTIRLRWGTSDELRRLGLLQYGFNIWRMPRAAAEAGGFDHRAPTPTELESLGFTKVNAGPVMASKPLPPNVNDAADRTTSFFSDADPSFRDGHQFYYFVTARDVLGRDGLSSMGGLATACLRDPPAAPLELAVRDHVRLTPAETTEQRLLVSWNQSSNATHYWVYRWTNPSQAFTNDLAPLSNRIAVVAADAANARKSYLDDGTGAPAVPGLDVYWYTVRAVNEAACDPLLSWHSAPISGVLRQREGPAAPTGTVLSSCGTPRVALREITQRGEPGLEPRRWHGRLICERRDRGIVWAQFVVTNAYDIEETVGPFYFPPDQDVIEIDYDGPWSQFDREVLVDCFVGNQSGQVSAPARARVDFVITPNRRTLVKFFTGQVLATAPSSADPFLSLPRSFCSNPTSVTPDDSGTVLLRFPFVSFFPVLLIQTSSNGIFWDDVGVAAADSGGTYAISYPACRIGPLPQFRGCPINVSPADSECPQHITHATDTGPKAPILLRFTITPRTREFRVYRQVNDGELTLISQGEAKHQGVSRDIVVPDDVLPPSSTRVCYYAQVLDEHGNPSPMASLGCKLVKPPQLPRPVLSEPQSVGDLSDPQVTLSWFCPPAGVHRFQVYIRRADRPPGSSPTGLHSLALQVAPAFNPAATYLNLNPPAANQLYQAKLNLGKYLGYKFEEARLTPPIGPNFGPGPQFTLTAAVQAGATYEISVASVDPQGHVASAPSEAWQFSWRPSPARPELVPWPARPLPPVNSNFHASIRAEIARDGKGEPSGVKPEYPVGVVIGLIPVDYDGQGNYYADVDGTFVFSSADGRYEPALFMHRDAGGNSILPVVLYRMQVTNAAFPRVSGDCVQVSPLIEQIAWRYVADGTEIYGTRVIDPYIGSYQTPESGGAVMLLRDLQPVIAGASYQYYLVRFSDKREIAEIIPAGQVTIPTNL